MKLATIATSAGNRAVRVDSDVAVENGHADLGELLANDDWADLAANTSGPATPIDEARFTTLISRPGKVLCVGLNYRNHILEMGRGLPEFPTLFAKYPRPSLRPMPSSSSEAKAPPGIGKPNLRSSSAARCAGQAQRKPPLQSPGSR